MNIALGMWIATIANRRKQQTGETAEQALTWVQEWVDTHAGAYHALGSPDGDDDASLLRWLDARSPYPAAREPPPKGASEEPKH